jgi:DNA-binding response OmpR family regulator
MNDIPRILLVSEQQGIGELLAGLLREDGFCIIHATDIVTSHRVLRQYRVDLALADAVLSHGRGTSVAAYAEWLGIPAIVMSRLLPVSGSRGERRHLYIRKPFTFAALRGAIDATLRKTIPVDAVS